MIEIKDLIKIWKYIDDFLLYAILIIKFILIAAHTQSCLAKVLDRAKKLIPS